MHVFCVASFPLAFFSFFFYNTGMIQLLLVLFIVMPIVELAVLLKVGSMIGIIPTITLVIVTGVIGVWLIRQQGLYLLMDMRARMSEGVFPGDQIIEGVFIIVAGALLVTPGFITDIMGFSILIPEIRMSYREALKKWLKKRY